MMNTLTGWLTGMKCLETLARRTRAKEGRGLFVTDLDGTLLTRQKVVAQGDLQALNVLREMGCLVAIATGRSNFSFNNLMETLGYAGTIHAFPADYVIFSTGAGIMDYPGSRILKSFTLGPEDVSSIAGYLESQHLDYMIHAPIPDTRRFIYRRHSRDNPDFQKRIKLYSDFAEPLTPALVKSSSGATELLCIVPKQHGHKVAERVRQALSNYSVIRATSPLDGQSVWIEIFAPGVSKSSAAEWLCNQLDIDRRKVGAVGNDYNDVDLLQWAKSGYVVDNAPEDLKAQFEIVSSNEHNGVGQATERWVESLLV